MTDTPEEYEYEDRITVVGFLRWMRDEAGAFLSVFGMGVAVYAVGFGLLIAFLQLDATFSKPLSGGVIKEHVTQHIAWAIRAWSVLAGMVTIYCLKNQMPQFARLAGWLGAFAAVLLLFHAYGVAAKIMEGQYSKAEIVETKQEIDSQSVADQIATIEKQKEGWRLDTANVVESNKRAIENITSDGLDNDDQAAVLQQANRDAQKALSDKIDAADNKILDLQASLRDSSKDTEDKSALLDSFNPLFTVMARASTWNFDPAVDPPNGHQYVSGLIFFTGFFGFGEILVIATFTLAFAMVVQARENSRKRNGVTVKFESEAEWEEWQAAKKKADNHAEGIRKRKEQDELDKRLKVTDKGYAREQRERIRAYAAEGMTPQEIGEVMGFATFHEFNGRLSVLFLAEEIEALFRPANDDEGEPPAVAAE